MKVRDLERRYNLAARTVQNDLKILREDYGLYWFAQVSEGTIILTDDDAKVYELYRMFKNTRTAVDAKQAIRAYAFELRFKTYENMENYAKGLH